MCSPVLPLIPSLESLNSSRITGQLLRLKFTTITNSDNTHMVIFSHLRTRTDAPQAPTPPLCPEERMWAGSPAVFRTISAPPRSRRLGCPRTDRDFLSESYALCPSLNSVGAENQASRRPTTRVETLDGPMNVLFITSTHPVILRLASGASGRASTAPDEAAGHRAAHSRAASSDGSSRIMNPPSCSLVSAYGPSCTPRFPSLILIVVPISGTSSGSPAT